MEKFFTQNDLILFAYNETNKTDDEKLFKSMQTNTQLVENYQSILTMKYCIESAFVLPQKRIVNNIMNYSRALWIAHTEHSGNFNVLMN